MDESVSDLIAALNNKDTIDDDSLDQSSSAEEGAEEYQSSAS